jgi:uncharacterized membrane protein (UPF0127 family)
MRKSILTKPFGYVNIGKNHYVVEVASDEEKRQHGLSRRTTLTRGTGMLFDLPKEDKHAFQMKDTYIPLDMVFINKSGQIVDYLPNVQPLTEGPYKPKEKCKFVLEVEGNSLKGQIQESSFIKMKFFDTLEKAEDYRNSKLLQEQLYNYLKEDINVEKLRREQSSSRKSVEWSRKVK